MAAPIMRAPTRAFYVRQHDHRPHFGEAPILIDGSVEVDLACVDSHGESMTTSTPCSGIFKISEGGLRLRQSMQHN